MLNLKNFLKVNPLVPNQVLESAGHQNRFRHYKPAL
jgi:hypothetical protein